MAKPEVKVKPQLPQPPAPEVVFSMDKATKNDFFRMRRKDGGWIVECVRIEGDRVVFRKDVHAWDLFGTTEKRMTSLALSSEFDR